MQATGATVGDALDVLFSERPHVRGYVLDEQGRLRKHVCIFADGVRLPHQAALSQTIRAEFHTLCDAGFVGGLAHDPERIDMSDRMLVATRKGLISFARKNGGWTITRTDFPGVAVTATLYDKRDDTLYAMLKHGHFGSKLHRSDDGGRSWTELPAPAFAPDAAGAPALFQVWTLEAGGANEAGRLWAGALPAGLFFSDDRGETWQQVMSLWDVPERAKWFGGGYDDAGIHTILSDPRDPRTGFRCDLVRRRLGNARQRQELVIARRGTGGNLYAAGAGGRARKSGSAPGCALRGRA